MTYPPEPRSRVFGEADVFTIERLGVLKHYRVLAGDPTVEYVEHLTRGSTCRLGKREHRGDCHNNEKG